MHPSVGLVGRILAIVLLTILIEFCASTILYDRASSLRVREDEAHRVAEHLAVAARVVSERPEADRPAAAEGLSTKNFVVRWAASLPPRPPMSADLMEMRRQIAGWEPILARDGLRLYLKEPGRGGVVTGSVELPDGSWLLFKAPLLVSEQKFRIAWIAMMLVVAVALSLIASLLVRWTLRPLRTLSEAAVRFGHGEPSPVPDMGSGEIRRLVRAFNVRQARIHSLISDQVEALAAVGHDLRTPLARLMLRADAIPDQTLRISMSEDIAEMERMVASLLAYLGGDDDPETPVRVDLASMVSSLVDEISDRGGTASLTAPDHLEHVVRPGGFKRAVRNLVENAAKYGSAMHVTLEANPVAIILTVEDDGPGIAEDEIANVLKPFVRLDTARGRDTKGLGLGLAIAVRAIEREGGALELSNHPEGGLRARITLPIQPQG
jgi:signal transduction histidine kinase